MWVGFTSTLQKFQGLISFNISNSKESIFIFRKYHFARPRYHYFLRSNILQPLWCLHSKTYLHYPLLVDISSCGLLVDSPSPRWRERSMMRAALSPSQLPCLGSNQSSLFHGGHSLKVSLKKTSRKVSASKIAATANKQEVLREFNNRRALKVRISLPLDFQNFF